MSISSEIIRLQNAKSALKTAIENKGVSVSSSTKLDGYASLVDSISGEGGGGGGGGEGTDWESIARGMLDGTTTFEAPASVGIDASISNICKDRKMTGEPTLKAGITTIAASAFYNCTISGITIPSNVTSIGQSAFEGAGLTSLVIPAHVTLASYVFRNMKQLVTLVVEEGITSLGAGAFSSCTKLESVTLPSTLDQIASEAFFNCSKLVSITLPSAITGIGGSAFRQCTSLLSIVIPDNVTAIDGQAFQSCTQLLSVTFGSSVNSIGNAAFNSCSRIQEMIFKATTPPTLANNGVLNYPQLGVSSPIYVPDASVEAYKTTGYWTYYANRVKGISERPTT